MSQIQQYNFKFLFSQIYLLCYATGRGKIVQPWVQVLRSIFFTTLIAPKFWDPILLQAGG
jgi:hypothetical protein